MNGDIQTEKMGDRFVPKNGANKRDVWNVSVNSFKGAHFATFPEELIEPCILAGSRIGGKVLDPFNGSGTTGLVSVKNGREYIGIEINKEYVEMSKERIEDEANQKTIWELMGNA